MTHNHNFKRNLILPAVLSLFSPVLLATPVVFDAGAPDHSNGWEATTSYEADDFQFSQDVELKSMQFWTAEWQTWDNTLDWALFSDVSGTPDATLLASGSGTNVTHTATGAMLGTGQEYEFQFDFGPGLILNAGTNYWIGLHLSSDFPDTSTLRDSSGQVASGIYWESTASSFGSSSYHTLGSDLSSWVEANTGTEPLSKQLAFNLTAETYNVPEPQTILLMSPLLVPLLTRRLFRQRRNAVLRA